MLTGIYEQEERPVISVIAGPNGSGKSTLYQSISQRERGITFLNADNVLQSLLKDGALNLNEYHIYISDESLQAFLKTHPGRMTDGVILQIHDSRILKTSGATPDGYVASLVVEFLRSELILREASFVFETVLSHPSKTEFIEEAGLAGYRTELFFVATENADINVLRVKNRAALGGHDVSAIKIRERYVRTMALLPRAIRAANHVWIFDNSGERMKCSMEISNGNALWLDEAAPKWIVEFASVLRWAGREW